jgi:uncharacterized protein (TIGR02444 family)
MREMGSGRPDFPDHPFWDFTIRVHGRKGVGEACLEMQRSHGIDVNLLFFCCWAGATTGSPLGRFALRRAMNSVAEWQEEVVQPIWRARWKLKAGFGAFPASFTEDLRRFLIAAELDAEHIEQLQLAATVPIRSKENTAELLQLEAAAANLTDYLLIFFEAKGKNSEPARFRKPLRTLLCGAFPNVGRGAVQEMMNRKIG